MQRVVDAQRAYDRATADAATAASKTATAKDEWQQPGSSAR
jgi:hypothetical protein